MGGKSSLAKASTLLIMWKTQFYLKIKIFSNQPLAKAIKENGKLLKVMMDAKSNGTHKGKEARQAKRKNI